MPDTKVVVLLLARVTYTLPLFLLTNDFAPGS